MGTSRGSKIVKGDEERDYITERCLWVIRIVLKVFFRTVL
jgi:hypothetical protein